MRMEGEEEENQDERGEVIQITTLSVEDVTTNKKETSWINKRAAKVEDF